MRTPEGYEKDDIKDYLDIRAPSIWYFLPYMYGYGKTGIPDIIGVYNGDWFSIEVKRSGKNPTIKQDKRMKEIEQAGGKVFWGDAKKVIAEFEEWIK